MRQDDAAEVSLWACAVLVAAIISVIMGLAL
jgi:hypothetical protein